MPRTLRPILEHAERQRDQALMRQRQAEGQLGAASQQHEQLVAYHGEHRVRWAENFQTGVSVALLHCHQGFTERLHEAVDIQSGQVERARQAAERARAATVAAEVRVAAIKKLIERRLGEADQRLQRSEQRQSDELAARAAHLARSTA